MCILGLGLGWEVGGAGCWHCMPVYGRVCVCVFVFVLIRLGGGRCTRCVPPDWWLTFGTRLLPGGSLAKMVAVF